MFRMIQDLIQLFVYYELASRVLASMFANTAKGKWQRQLLWLEALPKVVDRIKNSAYIQLCPTSRQTRQPLTLFIAKKFLLFTYYEPVNEVVQATI